MGDHALLAGCGERERIFAIAYANAIHRNAHLEDTATMEDTFAGLQSGVLEHMPLMDDEVMLRHQDQVWHEYMGLEKNRT